MTRHHTELELGRPGEGTPDGREMAEPSAADSRRDVAGSPLLSRQPRGAGRSTDDGLHISRRNALLLATVTAAVAAIGVEGFTATRAHAANRFEWPFPLSLVFREFGPRPDFTQDQHHNGIDFSLEEAGIAGTPVHCAGAGTVTFAGYWNGYGNRVDIDHGDGLSTHYHHLKNGSIAVSVGQQVPQWHVVGGVGATGLTTGTHLHFQTDVYGLPVNPRDFMVRYQTTTPSEEPKEADDMPLRFIRNTTTGTIWLTCFETDFWYPVPSIAYRDLLATRLNIDGSLSIEVPSTEFDYLQSASGYGR